MATILCIDDDADVLRGVAEILRRAGHEALTADGVVAALQVLDRARVDLIITDWAMPGLTGIDLLELLQQEGVTIPVIVLTGFDTVERAVQAIHAGAANFIVKPFGAESLRAVVSQALEVGRLRAENDRLLREAAERRSQHEILGESAAMRRLLDAVHAAATSRVTVLLQGESGTGKELVARAIHEQSDRSRGPFVRINCAAMPEGLIESTLFGHEKGAFTGAVRQAIGAFERAEGGTLLLDEISEMRLDLQPKLLRVLQEREFERVGGAHTIQANVRVIATTNRDLAAAAAAGTFRPDLYYRLSVFPIAVPPLRERRDDIPLLAYRFGTRAAAESGKVFSGFTPAALELLKAHDWPGNVRELQHAVERAVVLATEPMLDQHLFQLAAGPIRSGPAAAAGGGGRTDALLTLDTLRLEAIEQRAIARALELANGNRTRAAEMLGIDVRTLRRKLND